MGLRRESALCIVAMVLTAVMSKPDPMLERVPFGEPKSSK
jgi:hypothetical protein